MFTTPKTPALRKISVYGQIAEVTQPGYEIAPNTKVGEKIVLIWWSYGAGCEIVPSGRALGLAPGAQVFVNLSPLPKPSWINGLKSYDVEGQFPGTMALYAPEFLNAAINLKGDTLRPPPMSPAEFMTMYRMLSTVGSPTQNGLQQFLLWAKDNPELARKYPACEMVEVSEMNLVPGTSRQKWRLCR